MNDFANHVNELICFNVQDHVAVITINNPPVNALTTGVPQGIVQALERVRDNADARAIVIHGAGRNFAAGADINEFVKYVAGDGPMPELNPAFNAIEAFPKPVIMAIHGAALGAGLELAMAGHYRIATKDAQLGQPEIKIGLIPGAGGTQRLPRLVGVQKAAEMCAFGESISAASALESGLIDGIAEDDLLASAICFAQRVTATEPRRTGAIAEKLGTPEQAASILAEIRKRCQKTKRNLQAPLAALDAIAFVVSTSLPDGLLKEAEIFEQLLHSDQSKALIHAFFGERAVAKVPGIGKDTPVNPVQQAVVIGAGTMGGGIAMALANAGISVRLNDSEPAALERGLSVIRKNYERSVTSGRMTTEQRDHRLSMITPQSSDEGFDQADIIIEAVFESLDLKKQIFAQMDRVAKPTCLLASNTSTLDLDQIATATSRPEMVIGTHFFSPANVMRLLEIGRGSATSDAAIATAMSLAKTIKKVGVVVGNGFGFVGNRMVIPYMDEAQFLVEEGATPEQVDRVLTDFGMAMGPFAVADLSGLDVFWRIHSERFGEDAADAKREPLGLEKLYKRGRYGQKTGAGWFRYGQDRKPVADGEVIELVQAAAREHGILQREISDQEILNRCLYALINEGARVLEEGIARRSVDIDVIYMTGYGFPSYRGGPMFYADTVGLGTVLQRLREFEAQHGERWKPAELLIQLGESGGRFSTQN